MFPASQANTMQTMQLGARQTTEGGDRNTRRILARQLRFFVNTVVCVYEIRRPTHDCYVVFHNILILPLYQTTDDRSVCPIQFLLNKHSHL